MRLKSLLAPTSGLILLCTGCASTVAVEAKGVQKSDAPIPPHVTYTIFPTSEVEKDPSFPTYAQVVAKKLNERGYKQSEQRTAKLAVYLAYDIKETAVANSSPVASPPMGPTSGTGPGMYASSGASVSSQGKRFTSQVVIVVTDLQGSRATGSLVELWRVETWARSSTNDLQSMVPLLVEAGFRHFGETTPTAVQHVFSDEERQRFRASE